MRGSAKASRNLCRLWKPLLIRKRETKMFPGLDTLLSGKKKRWWWSKASARLQSFAHYIAFRTARKPRFKVLWGNLA